MTEPSTTLTFRDRMLAFVPRWLRTGTAARILYAIALHFDVIADLFVEAVRKRFGQADAYDALPYIGADRKMFRGPNESDAQYSARLATWLDAHQLKGNPYVLLQQLYLYYAPNNFQIDLVYASSGLQFSIDVNGAITYSFTGWREPDGNTARWARWRLFFHWPTPVQNDGFWFSPGLWDDSGVWDSNLTVEQVAEIRTIPNAWNAGHALGLVMLFSGEIEFWDTPTGLWDDGLGLTWNDVYNGVATVGLA